MSTNEILVYRAEESARLEELRRLEAEQAKRERQRLGLAQHAVTQLDAQLRSLIAHRDQAARRLPDLTLQAPAWPTLSNTETTAFIVEQYAAQLERVTIRFEEQLQSAIKEAEATLADRLARTHAWRNAVALEQAIQICQQDLVAASHALQETPPALQIPDRPTNEASLPRIQRYLKQLQEQVDKLHQLIASAQNRKQAKVLGQRLSGNQVTVMSTAQAALTDYDAQQRDKAYQELQTTLAKSLHEAQLSMTDLPTGTQTLLKASLEARECTNQLRERIRRLVARERILQEHATQALLWMQSPPDLVHAHPERAKRWLALLLELESVAAGLTPLSPQYGLEYEQIKSDAQRDLDRMYVEKEFVNALLEQGFNVLSEPDGLIIEDLRHLGVWLEETQLLELADDGGNGGIATVLELKTDRPMTDSNHDEQVIASVCERIQAASQRRGKVKGELEIVQRKKRIERGPRPARLKSLSVKSSD